MTVLNILVIKLRYIGDVILTTPMISILSRRYPGSRIHFLVNKGTEDVLLGNPAVTSVTCVPRSGFRTLWKFFHELRQSSFDCVIDLTDGDRSALISVMSRAPIRIGFNHEKRWRGKFYTHCIQNGYGTMHIVDYHTKALEHLGIMEAAGNPEIVLSDEEIRVARHLVETMGLEGEPWIMIHPAARYWFKAWPAERFAALGDTLVRKGFQVVMVGSENERELADRVMQAAHEKFISLVGNTTIRELAGLMKHCRLFVGNDAGPMHMAAAMGCPVVALFGPTDPAVWGPRGAECRTIYKGLDCRECFHPGCQRGEQSCMKLISVEEVLGKVSQLLSD